MFGLGPLEVAIVLLIVLVLFGARRLPQLGRELGSGMREFKDGIVNPVNDVKQEFTNPMAETERPAKQTPPALPRPAETEAGSGAQMRDTVSE